MLEIRPHSTGARQGTLVEPARTALFLDSPRIPVYEEELWTSKQRQASSIHEVSYRACFKPQLPAYFIDRLSDEGDLVYDPFSGRGTTAVEAALRGRRVIANDVNPLSAIFARPRLEVPHVSEVDARLNAIELTQKTRPTLDLSMFFHADTERELLNLRAYLNARRRSRSEDAIDRWIRMVATNRLTGHSHRLPRATGNHAPPQAAGSMVAPGSVTWPASAADPAVSGEGSPGRFCFPVARNTVGAWKLGSQEPGVRPRRSSWVTRGLSVS